MVCVCLATKRGIIDDGCLNERKEEEVKREGCFNIDWMLSSCCYALRSFGSRATRDRGNKYQPIIEIIGGVPCFKLKKIKFKNFVEIKNKN